MPFRYLLVTIISIVKIWFSLVAGAGLVCARDNAILVSPEKIAPGQIIRVLVASENSHPDVMLKAAGPSGSLAVLRPQHGGGPPYWWTAEFVTNEEGIYTVWLEQKGSYLIEKSFSVNDKLGTSGPSSYVWQTKHSWTRPFENLYAAWIERLFMDREEGHSWDYLHQVLRDDRRNMLHNHLGLEEDSTLILDPDCADNPFFFRAYFAWKLGLPYGHHACNRGSAQMAPECGQWFSNHSLRKEGREDLHAFQNFARTIKNIIHSGSARTKYSDNNTDLYPVPLHRDHLRPGVVFADPYGHTLMIVRWVSQTESASGQLLAVDAQPDGTIGIRRFWRGQFLFATKRVIGEPGFKAFRPIVLEKGQLRTLTNSEIADSHEYGNFSLRQQNMNPQEFYDRMDRLINPQPLDPIRAFQELHDAVKERLIARARAVANGEKYMQENDFKVIPMPSGARIFQTSGPWEDYSTPARDMRLLIALDVLLDFPDKVIRNPEAFAIPPSKNPADLRAELENLHQEWALEITIDYTRSNGLTQTLSLAEILKRREKLEMAYNPNDGVEVRWGASEGNEEFSSCQRRAPIDQRTKMASYRKWFKTRTFPIR